MSIETIEQLNGAVQRSRNFAIGVMALFVVGYGFWFWGVNGQFLSGDVSDWGVFGDFIGGILNPLIAYLAFYWLTKSIVMQRSELEQARESFIDQLNMTRKESVRVQLQEYMAEEEENLTGFLDIAFSPFNFSFDNDRNVVGISSFEQLKGLFKGDSVLERKDFLSILNGQINTTYGGKDANNYFHWNSFNRLLKNIRVHILRLADYVLMFVKVCEIYGVADKKLELLAGYIFEAYEIGAIGLEEYNKIVDQINAARGSSWGRYSQFREFLEKENSALEK